VTRERLQKFNADPYEFVDQLNISFRGNNLNIFQKYKRIQRIAGFGSVFFVLCWILFGFDSTPLQFVHVLTDGIPAWISGSASFQDLGAIYSQFYGKEMHYSAFVIYFLLFYLLSRSWERAGITKSKNLVFSFAGMFLGIAVFEWFWILGFATFQNQPWVATWRFPQMKILLQNMFFTVAGGVTVLYMLTERWHWKGSEQLGRSYFFRMKEWKPWLLIMLSIFAALLWIYYPWHVQQLTVTLENGGIWQSSRMFPQTLYTVDLNPADGVNAGVWFWIENDLIHFINTGVKTLFALTTYCIFRVRKPSVEELD